MAYDASILSEAQELYFAGQSAAKIAEALKSRHPETCERVCEKTVLAWITKPDVFGETWLDKKAKVNRKAEEKRIDASADEIGRMNGLLVDAISIMKKRLEVAQDFASTSPEYTAQVLMQLIGKRVESLKNVPVGNVSGAHVSILFEIIQADAELGPVWERRRAEILKGYQEKCRAAGLS